MATLGLNESDNVWRWPDISIL